MKRFCSLFFISVFFTALAAAVSAADTWKLEYGDWYCYDKDGNKIYGEWKSDGGRKYWLDRKTGAMVKDQLIDTDGGLYYVSETGEKVTGAWRKVPADNGTDGFEYMYFVPGTGQAVVFDSPKDPDRVINGKRYRFSREGYMLYGYLDEEDQRVQFPSEADRYFGTKEDGGACTGWVNVRNGGDFGCNGLYQTKTSVWFYFDEGHKIKNRENITIGGRKYSFDRNGAMWTGWQHISGGTDKEDLSTLRYFGDADDGIMKKKQWVSTKTIDESGEIRTERRYLTEDGSVYRADEKNSCVKKIDGKYYCFDSGGELLSGFIVGWTGDPEELSFVALDKNKTGEDGADTVRKYVLDQTDPEHMQILMYSAADKDGEYAFLRTGIQKIDGTVFYFDKAGCAYEGLIGGKIYNNGAVETSGDDNYRIAALNKMSTAVNGRKYYMVGKSGDLLKNRICENTEGVWFYVGPDYRIYRMAGDKWGTGAFCKEAAQAYLAQRAAANGPVGFTADGSEYICRETPVYDKRNGYEQYVDVVWEYR